MRRTNISQIDTNITLIKHELNSDSINYCHSEDDERSEEDEGISLHYSMRLFRRSFYSLLRMTGRGKCMHDLIASQDILKQAIKVAAKNKLKKITKITVKLGKIIEHHQEIMPENLRFNFELVKRNTIAEKARLKIKKTSGKTITISVVEGEK